MNDEKRRSFWKLLKDNADQIKIVSGLVVAGFVLYQYCSNQWQNRTDKTLEFAKDYYAKEVLIARNFAALGPHGKIDLIPEFDAKVGSHPCVQSIAKARVTDIPWYFDQDELWNEFKAINTQNDQSAHTAVLSQQNRGVTKDSDINEFQDCKTFAPQTTEWLAGSHPEEFEAIFRIMNLLSRISNCMREQICDSKTACDLFYSDAYKFMLNWGVYLEPWSRNYWNMSYFKLAEDIVGYCASSNYYLTREESDAWRGIVMWVNGMTNSWL